MTSTKLVRYTRSTALKTLSMETSTTQKIKSLLVAVSPTLTVSLAIFWRYGLGRKQECDSDKQQITFAYFFKNALFLYALTFSNYLIGLFLLPYLSRVLSVEKFGVIGFATSFCLVFDGGGVRFPAVDHRDHLRASRRQGQNVPNHLDDDVHQAATGMWRIGRVPGMRDVRGHALRC